MLTHQAVFFFRRNKNNNSNDRWFALESIFFPSLFLSRSLVSSMFLSLYFFYCQSLLPMTFFSFSLHIVVHESEFSTNQITFFVVRRPGEKKCVCVYIVVAFDKSRLFCPRKKMCKRKGESLSSTFVVCYMIY